VTKLIDSAFAGGEHDLPQLRRASGRSMISGGRTPRGCVAHRVHGIVIGARRISAVDLTPLESRDELTISAFARSRGRAGRTRIRNRACSSLISPDRIERAELSFRRTIP